MLDGAIEHIRMLKGRSIGTNLLEIRKGFVLKAKKKIKNEKYIQLLEVLKPIKNFVVEILVKFFYY